MPGIGQRQFHAGHGAGAVGRRRGDVVGVGRAGRPGELGVDGGAAGHGAVPVLEDEGGGTFGRDETVPADVEGTGVARGRQGGHVGEGGDGDRVQAGLGAATDDDVAAARRHQARRRGDGMCAGGACRHDDFGRTVPARGAWRSRRRRHWPSSWGPAGARPDGRRARCRRRPARPTCRTHPTPGGEDDARLGRVGPDLAGVLHGQVGRGDAELGEPVDLAHLLGPEPLLRLEVAHRAHRPRRGGAGPPRARRRRRHNR